MHNVRTLLPIFVFASLFRTAEPEMPITCQAGHFMINHAAYITCRFYEQIKWREQHVHITLYPFTSPSNFSGENILTCSEMNQSTPRCRAADGVLFDHVTTDSLTIKIPKVTRDKAGSYLCQLVPPDGRHMHVCNLTVHGSKVQPYSSDSNDLMIAILTVGTIINIAWIALIFVFRKNIRNWCVSGNCPTRKREKNNIPFDTEDLPPRECHMDNHEPSHADMSLTDSEQHGPLLSRRMTSSSNQTASQPNSMISFEVNQSGSNMIQCNVNVVLSTSSLPADATSASLCRPIVNVTPEQTEAAFDDIYRPNRENRANSVQFPHSHDAANDTHSTVRNTRSVPSDITQTDLENSA